MSASFYLFIESNPKGFGYFYALAYLHFVLFLAGAIHVLRISIFKFAIYVYVC